MDEKFVSPTSKAGQSTFGASSFSGNAKVARVRRSYVASECASTNAALPVANGNQPANSVTTGSEHIKMANKSTNLSVRDVCVAGMSALSGIRSRLSKMFLPLALITAGCLILASGSQLAYAQPAATTAAISGQLVTPYGGPAASANVRICLVTASGIPCTPTAAIYSDYLLTNQLSNPITADQYGNYKVYLAAGLYTVQVFLPGSGQPTYIYAVAASASTGGGGGAGNPAAPAFAVQIADAPVTGFAADGFININPTNHLLTARITNGQSNSDSYATGGGNNGVPNFQSSTDCFTQVSGIGGAGGASMTSGTYALTFSGGVGTGAAGTITVTSPTTFTTTLTSGGTGYTSPTVITASTGGTPPILYGILSTQCTAAIPPTSTDTIGALPLATVSGKAGSYVEDYRFNGMGRYSTNPGISPVPQTLNWQTAFNDSVMFTKPSPPPTLGSEQLLYNQTLVATQPCFSNGIGSTGVGGPFEAPPGYLNVVQWCVFGTTNLNTLMYSNGIHQNGGGTFYVYAGNGDDQDAYDYMKYAGGFTAPSDEGEKHRGANMSTVDDATGTFATVTDPAHYHVTYTNASVGDGRLIVDTSAAIATQTFLDVVTSPSNDMTTPGTAVMNEVTLPVSSARGHFPAECDVPAQTNGVVTVTCPVVLDSGLFGTTSAKGIASEASPSGNLSNLGINVTAAGALGGGSQSLTMAIHKSIPAGAFICQGGMAGTAIELVADSVDQASDGQPVSGQVVPVFCSLDAHTVEYAYPNSSQNWATLIVQNSQQRTTGIATQSVGGGAYIVNLSRSGNVVTGVVTVGGTTGLALLINGFRFFTITGCSDSSFNVTFDPAQIYLNGDIDPTGRTFQYADTNPDSAGCTGAKLIPQETVVNLWPAAEIYDVQNPTTGTVDGTMIASYQPEFTAGHTFKAPTNQSANIDGDFLLQNIAQPSFGSNGYHVQLNSYSALGGSAYFAQVFPISNQIVGGGGNVFAPSVLSGSGQFHYGLNLDTAPDPLGAVINVGFASGLCTNFASGVACPIFKNYPVIQLEGGLVDYSYNELTSTFTQTIGNLVEKQSPTATTFYNSTIMQTAQFGFNFLSPGSAPITQLRPISSIGNGSTLQAVLPAWDNVLTLPTVTAITTGTTQYIYGIAVNYPHGLSWTPPQIIFNGASTPNNTISCSVLPAGMTGTVYSFTNPQWFPITTGTCTSPSATVTDNGTYGSPIPSSSPSFAADYLAGGFVANPLGGFFFAPTGTGAYAGNSAGISQTSNGILSVDTTTRGDGLGEIDAAAMKVGGVPVCTTSSCASALTGTLTTTGATTDSLTLTGMTASGHCGMAAASASAATNIATSWISTFASNSITLTHTATAGMVYTFVCSPN